VLVRCVAFCGGVGQWKDGLQVVRLVYLGLDAEQLLGFWA
jgi:hypothetical protein